MFGIPGRLIGPAGQNCWGNEFPAKPPEWLRGRRVLVLGKPSLAGNHAAGYSRGCAPLPPGLWTAAGLTVQSGPGAYCQICLEHCGQGEREKMQVRMFLSFFFFPCQLRCGSSFHIPDSLLHSLSSCCAHSCDMMWCSKRSLQLSRSDSTAWQGVEYLGIANQSLPRHIQGELCLDPGRSRFNSNTR